MIHKRKPGAAERWRRSVCGQAGYVTTFWKNVTCDECLRYKSD